VKKRHKKKAGKRGRGLPNMVLRGQSGPKITFKRNEKVGYEIYRKYFLKEAVLIGTVRKDRMFNLWCAFKWEPEEEKRGGTKVYAKGGKTRIAAVRALLALL
jgi:hypothetical protein